MERELIIDEYNQLRDYLNRPNKISNERTELSFEIEQFKLFEYRLYAISESQLETHKIALAERTRSKIWERTGFTDFRNLEEFCATEMNEYELEDPSRKTLILTQESIREMSRIIAVKLKNLLFEKLYEPKS